MATITGLRQGHVNHLVHRTDATTRPWSDTEIDVYTQAVLRELWPRLGSYTTGDVTADETVMQYTIPASIDRVTRIDIVDANGLYVDRILNWRKVPGGKVVIKPRVVSGLTIRFVGWKPFDVTGSDLPARLDHVVAMRSAARCWSALAADLLNSQRQQNLDSGRVVSYGDAFQLGTYYEARYQEAIADDPARVGSGVRSSTL